MKDQLKTLPRPTSSDTLNAISSRESVDGLWPCDSQDGQTTGQCGPGRVLVNLSPRQAKELGLLTSGTYGLPGTGSSASAALQQSLESRLRAGLQCHGSILYQLTWKDWVMPSGRCLSRLVASARRTSDKERSGWPTPSSTDYKGGYVGGRTRHGKLSTDRLDVTAQLTLGPIPNVSSSVTESPAQLNPKHSRWLMGFPEEWNSCGVTAMQSYRKSPQNLSSRSCKNR